MKTSVKLLIAQSYTALLTLSLLVALGRCVLGNTFGKLFHADPFGALLVAGVLVFFVFLIWAAADKCAELAQRLWDEDDLSFDDEGRPELSSAMQHELFMAELRDEHAAEYEYEHYGRYENVDERNYNGHPTLYPDVQEAQVAVAVAVGRATHTADQTQISEWATPSAVMSPAMQADVEAMFEQRHYHYLANGGTHTCAVQDNSDLPWLQRFMDQPSN